MNKEIEQAIDILVDSEADMNYTKEEIANAYLLAIQALREKESSLEAQQADMWIPVASGRLPDLGVNVKVTWRVRDIFEHTNEDETEIAYRSVNYPYDWTLSRSNQSINVIAWKPLDKPYEEKE